MPKQCMFKRFYHILITYHLLLASNFVATWAFQPFIITWLNDVLRFCRFCHATSSDCSCKIAIFKISSDFKKSRFLNQYYCHFQILIMKQGFAWLFFIKYFCIIKFERNICSSGRVLWHEFYSHVQPCQ